jgi:hypothetical protein
MKEIKRSEFSKITADAINEMQFSAGMILSAFDPANPSFTDEDVVCATTGDITATYKPTFENLFDEVNNAPENVKEGLIQTGEECGLAFTALNYTTKLLKLGIGAADIDATANKVTPRRQIQAADFGDIWWVGDKIGGGFAAAHLKNAFSLEGITITATNKGKGKIAISLRGFVSLKNQTEIPMEFFAIKGSNGNAAEGGNGNAQT